MAETLYGSEQIKENDSDFMIHVSDPMNVILIDAEYLIDKIQEIRSRNNKNWMNLLRLAFKYAPQEAAKIMQSISECDTEINKLSKQLGELK